MKNLKILLKELNNIKTIKDIKNFFNSYDVLILIILSIKIDNHSIWFKSWIYIYKLQQYDNYISFFENLKNNWINNYNDFIKFIDILYYKIKENKLEFNIWNDLSLVFSNKPLEDLICICKKINIHSNKETKEFTQETCIEAIYFYRANEKNRLCEKIYFNQMMKSICKDTLLYLKQKNDK